MLLFNGAPALLVAVNFITGHFVVDFSSPNNWSPRLFVAKTNGRGTTYVVGQMVALVGCDFSYTEHLICPADCTWVLKGTKRSASKGCAPWTHFEWDPLLDHRNGDLPLDLSAAAFIPGSAFVCHFNIFPEPGHITWKVAPQKCPAMN